MCKYARCSFTDVPYAERVDQICELSRLARFDLVEKIGRGLLRHARGNGDLIERE